jgi:hypothetical protein
MVDPSLGSVSYFATSANFPLFLTLASVAFLAAYSSPSLFVQIRFCRRAKAMKGVLNSSKNQMRSEHRIGLLIKLTVSIIIHETAKKSIGS